MRLINTHTLALEEFTGTGSGTPKYAILSHTWGEEELSLQEWIYPSPSTVMKSGYEKILSACAIAARHGFGYIWIDTNCIDKTSSAELSEAINSMFNWYRNAEVCYAYLADVSAPRPKPRAINNKDSAGLQMGPWIDDFGASRWFTRGWTLQELLAPKNLHFYDNGWSYFGTKAEFAQQISKTTGIGGEYLVWGEEAESPPPWVSTSIAERMSWLSRRETGRVEDIAYCMLGIFGINMSLLYGEGWNAFFRLQQELIRNYDDHTLFCW
ncbi:heterokaryon incompatibility protein-domain-containing protein, partial [Lasiosphaeris hirsuta]